MAQGRFHRFTEMRQVHTVIESQMERMWKDGEDQFDDLSSNVTLSWSLLIF